MCVNDIRLARQVRSKATNYNTTGPVATTFQRNAQRVGITIARDAAVLGATAATVVTFDNGSVIQMGSALSTYHLTAVEHGDLVTRGFVVTAIATQHTGVITEYELPESVLAAYIEEFKRKY